jgi:hypothetical protein
MDLEQREQRRQQLLAMVDERVRQRQEAADPAEFWSGVLWKATGVAASSLLMLFAINTVHVVKFKLLNSGLHAPRSETENALLFRAMVYRCARDGIIRLEDFGFEYLGFEYLGRALKRAAADLQTVIKSIYARSYK